MLVSGGSKVYEVVGSKLVWFIDERVRNQNSQYKAPVVGGFVGQVNVPESRQKRKNTH